MNDFTSPKDELIRHFRSDSALGLGTEQAAENAHDFGVNTFTREKPVSLAKRIFAAATEPMILMLIAAGLIALSVNLLRAFSGGEADFLEVVGIFIAISLSVIITVVMEGRSAKAFEALSKINENTAVKAIRNGSTVVLSQKDIVCGDILLLATGDRIPADGRLLEANGLAADESALTGESLPAKKDADALITDPRTAVADRVNMLYSGTYVTSGFCKLLVTAVGDRTEFGRIAQALSSVHETSTPLQEKLARLGKLITVLGIIAASIVFVSELISFALHGGLHLEAVLDAFITSIVLIVAAVPEGLPTIVAVSLSINIIKLSKQNALVKKMIACETVGCINVICSDKTGTLTENKMTVMEIWDGSLKKPSEIDSLYLLHNFCLNSTADLAEDGTFIGNPTEGALLTAAKASGHNYLTHRGEAEILHVFPFSSDEKHMTTVAREDGSICCFVKGSPESVLPMCQLDEAFLKQAEAQIEAFQKKARRVLAFAHKETSFCPDYAQQHDQLEHGMVFDGFVAISDPLRADVYDAVRECRRAGIDLKILTGDNLVTATAIASELDLLSAGRLALEAREIEALSDAELKEKLPSISVIARSTPTVKMRVVTCLKELGNVVAVTGDGINDAPALKNADVGIAMGISGTEVSKEASDIVLLDDSFSTILKAIEWGRGVYENFKRFISFQLTVNVSSVIVVLVSILMGLKAPFTALELLWINIIMDGPPALTLGLEPPQMDLMKQKPTRRDANILPTPLLLRIGISGLYISAVFLLQYRFNFLGAAPHEQATVLFTLFTLFQLFNSFNCRELHRESIFKHLFSNRLMLLIVGITFLLQILIIQFAGAFFGTVPLALPMWCKLFALSFTIILWSELIKLALRCFGKN